MVSACGRWDGEVPERSNGAVSKTVVLLAGDRGFESLPLRHNTRYFNRLDGYILIYQQIYPQSLRRSGQIWADLAGRFLCLCGASAMTASSAGHSFLDDP